MTLLAEFTRVTPRTPCPICGKPDWCLVSRDNPTDPDRVLCARIESQNRWGEAGFLHVRRDAPTSRIRERVRTSFIPICNLNRLGRLQDHARAQITPRSLEILARHLGVPGSILDRTEVGLLHADELRDHGFESQTSAWAFPMRDAAGRIIGLRLRRTSGPKHAIPGSRNGLFIPTGLSVPLERLYIAEGESDTAALISLGVKAIGRAGCNQGVRLTAEYVRRTRARDVVVVADGDEPGRVGARRLAQCLAPLARRLRVIVPPAGIKDARDWVKAGLTARELDEAVACSSACRVRVEARRHGGAHGNA